MNTIYINGKFLSQRVTGVQRYAREILNIIEKDSKYDAYKFIVVCPSDANIPDGYNKVTFIKIKRTGYFFEQITLPKFVKKNKGKILLNLCNLSPVKFPGCTVIHDLNLFDNKDFYSLKYRLIVGTIIKRNIKRFNQIYTVSNFSKKRICEKFKLDESKIITTYSGITGMRECSSDYSEKFNFGDKFYLTVGSFNKTKNMKFVLEAAKNNKDKIFVITGGMDKIYQSDNFDRPDNVYFTGYITDDELSYLYSKCYAFIFPSFYEGFGAPPLEAISYGCRRIILSNIDVFKEIYGDYASYCDPYDVNTINQLLENPKVLTDSEASELVNKYSWDNVVIKIIDGIKEML